VAKAQTEEEPPPPPEPRPESVLIAVESDAAEFPEAWPDMQTQVPVDELAESAVDVSDLMADLAFGAESSIAEAEAEAEARISRPETEKLTAILEEPAAARPHTASHQDQSATIMVSQTPYQKAQALSQAQLQNDDGNQTLIASMAPQHLPAPRPPRKESITEGTMSFEEVELSTPHAHAPKLDSEPRPTLLDSPSDRAQTSESESLELPLQAKQATTNERPPERQAEAAPQNLAVPPASITEIEQLNPSAPPEPPPPKQKVSPLRHATPTTDGEMAPVNFSAESTEIPDESVLPKAPAPKQGQDPFSGLAVEPPSAPEPAPKPPEPVSFADLSNLSAQVKAAEDRQTSQSDLDAIPLEQTPNKPEPAPAPTPDPIPRPAPTPQPEARPMTASSDAASSHGLKVDFVSASAPTVPSPSPPVSGNPAPPPEQSSARQKSSAVELAAKAAVADEPADILLANIPRPVVVVSLAKPSVEEEVHLLAISMTAAVKKARVDSQKSLLLSGLLLPQAKLLRSKLRARNIPCKIVDPSTLNLGYSLHDITVAGQKSGKAIKGAIYVAIATALIVGLVIVGQSYWSEYKINSTLRKAAMNVKTQALPKAPTVITKPKPKPKVVRKDIISQEEIGFGGRSRNWWIKRIKKLRIRERSAPAAERADFRIRLLDTERKAKILGIVVVRGL